MRTMQRIGVLGGGLVGMSWASLFLARGLEVVVIEPRPEAAEELTRFIAAAWPQLAALGLADGPPREATLSSGIEALAGVDFIQECLPDRLALKQELIRQAEAVIGTQALIASSTSSLLASDIQQGAQHPQRILVAHPMNPPHLIPMVELVAGRQTAEASMQQADAFYRSLERVTIRVQREVVGHLANRLTAALYREAVHIAAEGIASVADIDRAITSGPGMRWALLGPHLTYHLGGGSGGYRHYLDHLGPTQEARWRELGTPRLSPELKNALVKGVEEELAGQDEASLTRRRDAALVELARLKRRHGF